MNNRLSSLISRLKVFIVNLITFPKESDVIGSMVNAIGPLVVEADMKVEKQLVMSGAPKGRWRTTRRSYIKAIIIDNDVKEKLHF